MSADWGPLERLFRFDPEHPAPTPCGRFMFMGTGLGVGNFGRSVEVWCYKHCDTRRYLNLDAEGQAWKYAPGLVGHYDHEAGRDYVPTSLELAMREVCRDDATMLEVQR